ncbi:MAG: DUF4292 domain-containing protein [Flavobacteriales bacterium]|nr:DUF4292 domain-containing protein [Flavobacteriales bacterium]
MKIRNYSLILIALVAVLVLNSCANKTVTTDYGEVELLAPKKLLHKIDDAYINPEYMSSTVKIKFKSSGSKNSFTAKLRMEKDKTIWINISFFGISFARGIMTPEGVSMYERQNGTFFKGDYKYISEMLGSELDFYQIQALLLGKPLFEIKANKYKTLISKNSLLLEYKNNKELTEKAVNNGDYIKRYWYNPINYELERQMLALPDRSTTLIVKNNNYALVEKKYNLPQIIDLQIMNDKSTMVELEYKGMKVDNKLSFPFSIPKDYTEIKLNK